MINLLISAQGISKTYKGRRGSERETAALLQNDIEVRSGQLCVIHGRSGSGKSTLLNILSGLLSPTDGTVRYDDCEIYSLGDRSLSRFRCEHTGYIPQGHAAVSTLTVRENILLPTAVFGDKDSLHRADILLKRLGLDKLADAYPNELSGGELRRLSIARALINSPDAVFADEPTNDLDDENSEFVFELLKETADSGTAVVVVTHESDVDKYADTVYHMKQGKLTKERDKLC